MEPTDNLPPAGPSYAEAMRLERENQRPAPKPEKIGTHCECGAPYVYIARLNAWGYGCAR